MELCKHGISTNTPENILFGAGAYYKNLKWDSANKRWTGVCLGATSGGGSVSIGKDIHDLELDGALVPVKGNAIKQGGLATMKVNIAEITRDNLKAVTLFEAAESDGLKFLQDKADIVEGDYLNNLAFVGKTIKGGNIIVIFEKALCTSGMETETKNKDKTVLTAQFECYAGITGDLNVLPVKIYRSTVAGEFVPDVPDSDLYLYGAPSASGNIGLRSGENVTLYDGVVAPELPIVDGFDNAWLTESHELIIATHAPLYALRDGKNTITAPTSGASARIYIEKDGDWVYDKMFPYMYDGYATGVTPIWANADILDETSGEVFLAASEPIPVGEIVDTIDGVPIYEVI